MSKRIGRVALLIGLSVAASAVVLEQSVARVLAQSGWEIVATGLDNPRGLGFAPDGSLFVAEAGRGGAGPCVEGAEGEVCYGPTGAITRVTSLATDPQQARIVTGLPSLAGEGGGGALGPHDISFQGAGNGWVTIGLGNDPAVRAELGAAGGRFGRLVRINVDGKVRFDVDLAGYEARANPDGGEEDSNPYGLAALPGRQVVTDAGGNSLVQVAANGRISTLAVFPTRPVGPIPMQAVPTTVVQGPDGALYVGQLTGFPFPSGGARVYRVPAGGGTPAIYASDFTNIIDIAFGADGSLYVLEIDADGLGRGTPTGRLVRVARNGTRTTIASAGLFLPGGVALGRDGSIYVTNFSVFAGGGQVVRITP